MAEVLYTKLDLVGSWHTMPSIRYLVGALIMGLCVAAWRVRQYRYTCATVTTKPVLSDKKETVITPLVGFDWEKTEPLQFRPFKGKDKFNLTMCEYLFCYTSSAYIVLYQDSKNIYRLTSISNRKS